MAVPGVAVIELWEILVPAAWPDGQLIAKAVHQEWDRQVRAITSGLTIFPPAKGQWVHQSELYIEQMIPVRVACTRVQLERVLMTTKKYYSQSQVMAYKMAEEVIFY